MQKGNEVHEHDTIDGFTIVLWEKFWFHLCKDDSQSLTNMVLRAHKKKSRFFC